MIKRIFLITTLTLLLNACTQTQHSKPEHLTILEAQNWQFNGRIGLLTDNDSMSGSIHWQQCANYFDIRLSGPLGAGATQIYGDKQKVTLKAKGKKVVSNTSPEQLLQQHLGWAIPVSHLFYWVKGIPAPDEYTAIDSDRFVQKGWTIQIKRWQSMGNYRLPSKLTVSHPQLKVTLLLKNWQSNSSCQKELTYAH